jgi:DNA polymerase III epsilon subunit-like protein
VKRSFSTLIRPEGWEIAPGAQRVHGISTKKALKRGVPVATVLPAFDVELEAAGLIVAHNLEFDQTIMTAEFIRAGLPHHFDEVKGFCTMRGTTEYCHLTPKKYGEYKWPKLSELHAICTGKPHAGAHDAMGDAEAVVRCLRALQKAQALQLSVVPKGALTS